jgi:hypothetical protein
MQPATASHRAMTDLTSSKPVAGHWRISHGLVLAFGLAIPMAVMVVVLAGSPAAILATNGIPGNNKLAVSGSGRAKVCQSNEWLPRGTRAIQPSIEAFTGPPITLEVLYQGHLVASGSHAANWSGDGVTIPVGFVTHSLSPVTICFSTPAINESLTVFGARTAPALAAHSHERKALAGRMRILYLGAGHDSWLARASAVADHMDFGHGWVTPLIALFMLAAVVASSRVLLGELNE